MEGIEMNLEEKRLASCDPLASTAVLEKLACDEDDWTRMNVADNRATPLATLEMLAKDKESCVRCWVARRLDAPLELLELLAKDENVEVREYVARNFSAPPSVLRLLADDCDDILVQVVIHPNCTAEIREEAAKNLR